MFLNRSQSLSEAQQWAEQSVQLLQDMALAANHAQSLAELLQFALDRVATLINWPVGHAYLFDESSDDLAPTDLWYLADPALFQSFRKATLASRFRSGVGLPGHVYASGQPQWIANIHEAKNFPRAERGPNLGVQAGFGFPVLVGNDVVAVLEFYTTQPTPPDERVLHLVRHVGAQLGRVVERIRADATLRASEAKFRAVAQSAPDAVVLINETGHVVFWNAAAEALFGYSASEMINQPLTHLMPEQYRSGHDAGIRRLRSGGMPRLVGRTIELEGLRRDGTVFPLELSLSAWQAEDGTYYSGILRDISERKSAERQLAAERNLLRTLVDTLPDYIYVKDHESRFLLNNSAHLRILGASSQEEVLGKTDMDIFPVELATRYRADEAAVIETRQPLINREELTVDTEGNQEWVLTTKVPLLDDNGNVIGLVGVTRDVTDRKQAQEALQQSEARFRAIFDHAAIGIGVLGVDTRLLLANAAMTAMLGYSEAELRTIHFSDVTHPDDVETTAAWVERVIRGEIDHFRLEKRYVRKDGTMMWGRVTCSSVRNRDGELQFLLSMIEDITEQRSMENNLREMRRHLAQSREAERRHLARELHDVPMQELYVAQYALQALINRQEDDQARADLEDVKSRLVHINSLLRNVCNQLRPPALESFGLDAAIRTHVEEFCATYPQVAVDLALHPLKAPIPTETSMVLFRICQQALNNVAKHAGADRVTIRLWCFQNQVHLAVQDNGQGFTLPHIWSELTREGHYGVAGMVERAELAGGSLTIQTQRGAGTEVRVSLPMRPVILH